MGDKYNSKESRQIGLEESKTYIFNGGPLTDHIPSCWGFPVSVSHLQFLSSLVPPSALCGAVSNLIPELSLPKSAEGAVTMVMTPVLTLFPPG